MLDIDRPLPGGVRTSTPAAGWLSPALHLSLWFCLLMLAEHETSPAGDLLPAQRVPLAFIEVGAGATGAGRFADDQIGPAPRTRRPGDLAVAPEMGRATSRAPVAAALEGIWSRRSSYTKYARATPPQRCRRAFAGSS